jgi:hypothetical protein
LSRAQFRASPDTDPRHVRRDRDLPASELPLRGSGFVLEVQRGTVRVNKRLSKGISLGANYQYSHSIDDAGALGSVGGVGVQDWQNPLGELGNSSLDVRHTVNGTYLYELPFGKDKFWVTTGVGSHILEGFSPPARFSLQPAHGSARVTQSSIASTACGTGGVLRPNLTRRFGYSRRRYAASVVQSAGL